MVLQLDEFGRLVTGLVELARGDRPARGVVPVRLDHLVERVVARARTHGADGVELVLDARPTTVHAEEDRVERAVSNLVDNAVKYAGADGPVEVTVADGTVRVRDHGPGIAAADLPHVFDRFYRVGRRPRGARVRARAVHRGPGRRGPRRHRLRRGGTRWRGGGLHGAARRAGRDRGGRRRAAPTPAAPRRCARGGRDVPGSRVLVVASPACLTP